MPTSNVIPFKVNTQENAHDDSKAWTDKEYLKQFEWLFDSDEPEKLSSDNDDCLKSGSEEGISINEDDMSIEDYNDHMRAFENQMYGSYKGEHVTVNITTVKDRKQIIVQDMDVTSSIATILRECSSATFVMDDFTIRSIDVSDRFNESVGPYEEPLELFAKALYKCDSHCIRSVLQNCRDSQEMVNKIEFCMKYPHTDPAISNEKNLELLNSAYYSADLSSEEMENIRATWDR